MSVSRHSQTMRVDLKRKFGEVHDSPCYSSSPVSSISSAASSEWESDGESSSSDNLDFIPHSPTSITSLPIQSILKKTKLTSGQNSVRFDLVMVFSFSRCQGFTSVPSHGGATLGMAQRHSAFQKYTVAEHAQEQQHRRRERLQEKLTDQRQAARLTGEPDPDTDNHLSDAEVEGGGVLQPYSSRQRQLLLQVAGVKHIDKEEKRQLHALRLSREACGCDCQGFCEPETCTCSLAGIKCQVQQNSPAEKAGLQPFFDFILSLDNKRLNQDNDMLRDLLKANMEKAVTMEVYSSRTTRVRELEVVPSNMWGGQGLLGASVRFCSYHGASENVWHVLDMEVSSPAALAGLQPHTDYIVGADQVLQDSEDFFSLIEAHEGKPLKLLVYNTQADACREVVVTPNGAWGGEGSLGCGIGYGYLHRIPAFPEASPVMSSFQVPEEKPTAEEKPAEEIPSVEEKPSSILPTHGFTEASLMAPSGQSEDVVDLEDVTIDETAPPLLSTEVGDLAEFTYVSDSEVAMRSTDAADSVDKLDHSVSSIDLSNNSLAIHDEKDSEISGVEELADNQPPSSAAENQNEPQRLSLHTVNVIPALVSSTTLSDSGIAPAELESTDLLSSRESEDPPSPPKAVQSYPSKFPDDPAEVHALTVGPPFPSPVDLFPRLSESTTQDSPADASTESPDLRSVEESAEPQFLSAAHQCG
ncbi:Golgi reassembly-stacking protein 1-like [Thalassophryne amazonica]|uniref:Golgi reassembly-stacking protein 1-like n=1 Tax=Thalassophryne amazonica TaxID=390379 RepID=UPI001471B183|nr:Golgi reassembly-stacking protein 1-like [Thalassophryne amazonica]